jgi:hypothetical protein
VNPPFSADDVLIAARVDVAGLEAFIELPRGNLQHAVTVENFTRVVTFLASLYLMFQLLSLARTFSHARRAAKSH